MTNGISRREAALLGGVLGGALMAEAAFAARPAHGADTRAEKIAMVLYPGMTALDLVGPLNAFSLMMGARIFLTAQTLSPVLADGGLALVPTHTFDQTPDDLDMLFVPGAGPAVADAMRDRALLQFLADRGAKARYVTSVCTGSLVLGAAGLLRGYRATSHWLVRDSVLPLLGATPVRARYVKDRNRITGAGVTSGIDFGLRVVAEFRGEDVARTIQLMAEYDPQPPYASGSPETARPRTVAEVRTIAKGLVAGADQAARAARPG